MAQKQRCFGVTELKIGVKDVRWLEGSSVFLHHLPHNYMVRALSLLCAISALTSKKGGSGERRRQSISDKESYVQFSRGKSI